MQIDLSNCDNEPIHIPGAIQPHGAMLVVDEQLLVTRVSANIESFLERSPAQLLGSRVNDELLGEGVTSKLQASLETHRVDLLNPVPLRDNRFDGIVHRSAQHIIIEIEPRPDGAVPASLFAVAAQTALSKLLALGKLQEVLDVAVEEIRQLTGFDRVMAYRFAPDFHGKVVAEDKRDDWEPYLGLHYPASDIPAQARRLYALNPIRLIVDANYQPVPIEGGQGEPPIDMSYAALRSVSPIHCEYLANIGVRASMSISVMVEGKLWGLIACHHGAPLHLSFATRITATLLARVLSMMIEQNLRSSDVRREGRGRAQIRRLMAEVVERDDVLAGLDKGQEDLLKLLKADGALVSLDSRIVLLGQTPSQEWAREFVTWLDAKGKGQFQTEALPGLYVGEGKSDHRATGVMAHAFHAARAGYVIAFRSELAREVSWAGNPREPATLGLHGDRLTPRGSFELWKETVAGNSRPWHPSNQALLEDLCQELTQIVLRWTSEEGRLRDIMISMVSHDLRTPLSAITMGAELIGDSEPIASRITSSSQRMSQLIETLVDFSLLQAGKGISIHPQLVDVVSLAQRVTDEVSLAYPGGDFVLSEASEVLAEIDPSRIEQVISNLVSNARHHGSAGGVIQIEVTQKPENDCVVIRVRNQGVIPAELQAKLFSAYKDRAKEGSSRHKGMGLGLFIVKAIVDAHGGQIVVESNERAGTCLTVTLPAKKQKRNASDSVPLPYG